MSNTLVSYEGDTVVDGYQAQRLHKQFRLTMNMGVDTMITASHGNFFTRTNGDLVWEWNGAEWDTLYWFSAGPGDQWQPFWAYGEVCPDFVWRVLDTAMVVVDGVPLRSLSMDVYESGMPMGMWFTLYERIGGAGGLGFPGLPPCGAIYECFCTFMCYRDQEIGNPLLQENCDFDLQVGSANPAELELLLQPNPGQDQLNVSFGAQAKLYSVIVRDALGRQLSDQSAVDGNVHFDTRNWIAGFYSVEAQLESGTSIRAKWIKE